ncbi:CheY-like chemotaxis protein [Oxalobacteraceae bacterium GrIS 1.11]
MNASNRRRLRVLHVDGDADAALVLAALLLPETELTHVATLDAAARAIRHERYNLIVLDPDLPDGNGAALLEVLEVLGDTAPPVLLYAARDSLWRRQSSGVLLKRSTSPRQLWHALRHLLVGAPCAPLSYLDDDDLVQCQSDALPKLRQQYPCRSGLAMMGGDGASRPSNHPTGQKNEDQSRDCVEGGTAADDRRS